MEATLFGGEGGSGEAWTDGLLHKAPEERGVGV